MTRLAPEATYHAPALEKGLDVLELLASAGVALSQAEIARGLDRSPSELFRILTVLERRSYLQRDSASGTYRLTLRLLELGSQHSPVEGLLSAAREPMQRLMEKTRESCHLSVLHQGTLLVVAQVEGPARVRVSVAVGSTISPLHSASGRVLLAQSDEVELARLLASDPDWGAMSPRQQQTTRRRLRKIATQGYESAYAESVPGVSDLSMGVGATDTTTRAALALTGLPRDHDAWVRQCLPELRRVVEEIEQASGIAGIGR